MYIRVCCFVSLWTNEIEFALLENEGQDSKDKGEHNASLDQHDVLGIFSDVIGKVAFVGSHKEGSACEGEGQEAKETMEHAGGSL